MSDQTKMPPIAAAQQANPVTEETGFYEPYAYFARNLRTWYVAYGIGGPVVFLTNDAASRALMASGKARSIVWLFLGGVALQILMTIVYKAAMWYQYMAEVETDRKSGWEHRASEWLTDRYWPEASLDLGTLLLFGWATVLAVATVVR